jgi:HSP20 family molecular chaperone IbpA
MMHGFDLGCDIVEGDEEFHIFVDLPGVEKENIRLSVTTDEQDRILKIECEKAIIDLPGVKPKFLRKELAWGKACRCFLLPTIIDQRKITSSLSGGVLRIRLPKLVKAESGVQVPIETGSVRTERY